MTIKSQFERQEGGGHYKTRPIEPLAYSMKNKLEFPQGSVVKYITRYREKHGAEDLKKVIHYAQFLLEEEYKIFSEIKYEEVCKSNREIIQDGFQNAKA